MNIIADVSIITTDEYFSLESGDTLILYTDGFPEAKNYHEKETANQLLDYKGFLNIIKKHIRKDIEGLKDGIVNDTLSRCHHTRDDDMTLIIIRRK